ncbi:chloramphenicol acetyltransferase [Flaviaesturariibacter flavus]|uniref:Chloramphenicol acetyltransferase n=1 Tax=Flaviaesturariibacter flavus TaxID=2502780 RepID=A0A4R1BBM9_9BACT|nr:CatA-like O-acetyltransferase [Flaviaesturariibacter flavus]TCJ14393.1 chloramphenicol acetyltransferase [Flaviaesturariibacter flavus]
MFTPLDLSTWNRRDHFHFFRRFEEPFFGVTVELDCTEAYACAKANGHSFFLYTLWHTLRAANATEPFRYRISGDEVRVYDEVHASPTINRPDGTFGFAYMDWHPELTVFIQEAQAEATRVRAATGLVPAISGENVLHCSSLPWLRFSGLSHARAFSFPDSCPKISYGKMTESNGRRTMPLSVHVHHALMDGSDVGRFVERLETGMREG